MAEIDLSNLYKIYDDTNVVLNNINLHINDGEFVVFLGPSGCGKTTLLNIISGLDSPTKGDILFNKNIVNNLEPKDRDIAMVFQNYSLYPHMNVFENLAFSLRNKKVLEDEIKERVNYASKLLKIDDFLDRKPSQLSGGQQQRVAIGRAIVRKPKVFLMDEPLSNLDFALRNEMREEIKKLYNKLHITMIYVTHDQIEALTLATKIVLIDHGIIQQIGTPLEVFNNPENEFVAQFLGTPRMNIFNNVKVEKKNNIYFACLNDTCKVNLSEELRKEGDCEEVDLGIRADCFELVKNNKNSLKMKVKYWELIGSEYLVHGTVLIGKLEQEIIVKINSNEFDKEKQEFLIFPNLSKIYIFNNVTKERI